MLGRSHILDVSFRTTECLNSGILDFIKEFIVMSWTNKQIGNYMLKVINEFGFTPKKIQRGDSYFVFDMGDDSVMHFEIKECPGWLFAFWIYSEAKKDENCVTFFTRHKTDLDKFKPTRSFFTAEYTKQDIMDSFNPKYYMFHELKEIIGHIKNNPITAYVQSYHMEATSRYSFINAYLRIRGSIIKSDVEHRYKDLVPVIQHKYKVPLLKKYDIVEDVVFKDNNSGGCICSPRYDMKIQFKTLYDEQTQIEKECEILNKFFRKKFYEYKNIDIYCSCDTMRRYDYD